MPVEEHVVFHSMGLPVHLTLIGVTPSQAAVFGQRAETVFQKWDRVFSRFREDSELARLNAHAGEWVEVSPLMLEVLGKCLALTKETEGCFDPSAGSYLAAAGYGLPKNLILPTQVPTYRDIAMDIPNSRIRTAPRQVLEPAALVKGMAIDAAGTALAGVPAWMVNAGGDLRTQGDYPGQGAWNVAIQAPQDRRAVISTVRARNEAVATSGTYETTWESGRERWHHQINMTTGKPTTGVISVTVLAPTAELADGFSSAALLLGIKTGSAYLNRHGIPWMCVDNMGRMFRNEMYHEREMAITHA